MVNVDKLISYEEKKWKDCREHWLQYYMEVAAPAIEQRPVEFNGETIMVDHIIFDNLSPEDREKLEYYSKQLKEVAARQCVLKNYIKSNVPAEIISEYDTYVEPIETYDGVKVSCSEVDLEDGEFSRTSLRVGDVLVESPMEMSIQEYNQIYTSALTSILSNGLTSQQAHDKIEEVCTDAYLAERKDYDIVR